MAIRKFSKKRSKQLSVYNKLRDKHFSDNPICEFPGCERDDVTLHHGKGRCGELLNDIRYFKSLCPYHHQWVELHPDQAKELGLSYNRL